jgi:hypothetical protein
MRRYSVRVLLIALLACGVAQAQEPVPVKITLAQIVQAPVFVENPNEILALAHQQVAESDTLPPEVKAEVQKKLDEIPYSRILDVEVAFFTGYPDLFAACLEGHVHRGLAIEGCASAAVFITSLSASLNYRWDVLAKQDSSGVFHELSIGPWVGYRYVEQTSLCIWGSCTPDHGHFVEYGATLEYVSWKNKNVAFTIQGKVGFNNFLGSSDHGTASMIPRPEGRVTFGIAWVKPKR